MAVIYLRFTPAWAISTAYKVGEMRYNDTNKVYVCTQAGTSAGSGGPTGTGTGITDNTAKWDYFGAWTANGADANDGSTWALAKATMAAAITAAGAGGTVYVSQSHSETLASAISITSPGTVNSWTNVICGNDSVQPPTTLAKTSIVSNTGAYNISISGYVYIYGINFTAGSGASSANIIMNSAGNIFLDNCNLILGGTSGASYFNIGTYLLGTSSTIVLNNTALKFSSISQYIIPAGNIKWLNTESGLVNGSSIPNSLFIPANSSLGNIIVSGVDLSVITGGSKSLVTVPYSLKGGFNFYNCKIGTTIMIITGSIQGFPYSSVDLHNCDSGNTNYRMERYRYQGSVKTETIKVRTGGASDGTTAISWNMTTLATVAFNYPLESPVFSIWNDTTGSSKTVTVEILHDSVTALNNDEVWLEVEELGTSGYPVSTIQSNRKTDMLATAAAQPTSSATWTTTGLTNPNKQSLSVTFTPQMKGYFQCKVMLAKASKTIYVDPLITVS